MSGNSLPSAGVAPEQYRLLMARFATGITIATALDARGEPQGMTASAVASVSLEPPMVLICVDHAADFHAAISGAGSFALSVLAHDQEHLSRRFAEDRTDKFTGTATEKGPGGLPLIKGAIAHIWCERAGAHEAGDHTVFFGRVTGGTTFDGQPLMHFRGRYTTTAGA